MRAQLPDAQRPRRAGRAQHRRRDRARHRRHRPPRRRRDDRAAGRPLHPPTEGVFRDVLRTAATRLATGALGADDALVTLGIQVVAAGDRVRLPDPAPRGRRQVIDGLQAYPLEAFEEKPKPARAEELVKQPGVAWNAGHVRVAAAGDPRRRSSGTRASSACSSRRSAPRPLLAHAYEQLKPVSIDFAVMESAARDGQVVMGSMDVGWSDIGSWTELLAAVGGRWHRVGRPARRPHRRERRRPRRAARRRGGARHPAAAGR